MHLIDTAGRVTVFDACAGKVEGDLKRVVVLVIAEYIDRDMLCLADFKMVADRLPLDKDVTMIYLYASQGPPLGMLG